MSASEAKERAAFLTDASGTIDTWNAACQRMFGFAAEAIVHRPVATLLALPSRQANEAQWREAACQPITQTLDILRADGSTLPADLTLAPQYHEDGSFRGCVACFALDEAANEAASEEELVGRTPLKSIVDLFVGTFAIINKAGHMVLWNKNMEQVTQLTPAELRAAYAPDLLEPHQRALAEEKLRQVFEHNADVLLEADFRARDGHSTPYLFSGKRIKCGETYYVCGMGLDISNRRRQEEQLRLRERALHAASNGIVITRYAGRDNPIEYVNPAFERITGYLESEVMGRDSRFMAAPGLDEAERASLRSAIGERREAHVIFRNLRKGGEVFWNDLSITPVSDESGDVTHFIGVITDVTASKQRTAHLEHEVNHDALTGLANRNLLWDRLEQALHVAQRNKTLVATVLIDLDNFKQINDNWGHEAGDEVLKAVAKRLQASVRDSDTVARLSGDEFVLVLANQPSLRFTVRMIERVRDAMARPVGFDSREIPVGASVGVSMYPHDGASVFDLVRAADVAMYHAKASEKKSEAQFFSPDMTSTTEAKHKLEADMRAALDRNEIFLVFQPRMNMKTGRVDAVEALLRWRHPEQGMLLPAAFLPEAEENGMIVPIGERVVEQVCALLRELRQAGFPEVCVSMNAVYREFCEQNYIAGICDKLNLFGLQPGTLELELREEHLMRNPQVSREVAAQMRELGLKLSIDNFGDGAVSLPQLQQLGASHLKMNQGTVHDIRPETGSGPMAKALIDIGHNLNMQVVAQGVETRAQMEFLKSNGCDAMQGLYFSEPLSLDALKLLLQGQPSD